MAIIKSYQHSNYFNLVKDNPDAAVYIIAVQIILVAAMSMVTNKFLNTQLDTLVTGIEQNTSIKL